jgi:predicted DCC family thiol-disulfide oxidoreductase YuxK
MVILFDGVCNLCNRSVQFVIQRDAHHRFSFASLQSDFGQRQLRQMGLPPGARHSVLLIKDTRLFEKSDAALEIARYLSGGWPLLYAGKLVPRFLRDGLYDWVARHRYRWFGKREECMLPRPEWRARFLD